MNVVGQNKRLHHGDKRFEDDGDDSDSAQDVGVMILTYFALPRRPYGTTTRGLPKYESTSSSWYDY
jgi:hypothetical protein